MLPLQQAYEVKHSILEYLKATFSFKDKVVHKAFYDFITHEEEGIFKGPYVSIKLPFVTANSADIIPLEIKPNFPPYDHQYKSFQRLNTTNNNIPKSTLITTGTSSGKTECFLYPILDFCHKNNHRPGIKVVILYPMNALATDQAKRLAEAIWNEPILKGKITAGLFIGEGKDKAKYPTDMGKDHIIENRDSIRDSPPDILLTNFKMLDYALMRAKFHNLWSYNLEDPSLLQFLVLDELHTYDGAQGTDVANLIRRLKLKLDIPKGQICAIGTSATIGSGEESKKLLCEYAEKVFGEEFNEEAIIAENRLTVDAFFEVEEENLERFIPRQIGLLESRLQEDETYENYINRQKRLWQIPEAIDTVALGKELKKLKIVKDLIALTSTNSISLHQLLYELSDRNSEFKTLPEWDEANELNPREEVVNSIVALISAAKTGKEKFPLLFIQIQIWIRELSGVLREMSETPKFSWKDKVAGENDPRALPAYFCRDCGSSGWLGIKDDNKNHFDTDPQKVYEYYFENHKNIYFINTTNHKHIEEYEPTNTINDYIGTKTLQLQEKEGTNTFKIQAVRKLNETRAKHICPECNSENTLSIIGTKIATLSSITVSQVLSSDLDPREDKYRKILAFTNSVQDAAHQAGFVEARNYRFTFRSSLQKVINELDRPVTLEELQKEFIGYWKINSDETKQNNELAYYYRFFPEDYKGKIELDKDYRMGSQFTGDFKKEFDERIRWEIVSEYGYNAVIGRTLEKSGASAVKFDEEKIKSIFPILQDWLSQNNLITITETDLLPFINGILHRIRIRGGVNHEYLNKSRTGRLTRFDLNWYNDNRHFLNKMFGSRSRFPKVISASKQSGEIIDTTYTNANNWYRSYFIKSFPMASAHQGIINDFYSRLLESLEEVKILDKVVLEGNNNYAILANAIIIENKVQKHVCNNCGSFLNVAASDTSTRHTRCLDYTCVNGVYEPDTKQKPNYYQLVYNRNRSPRIYAAEHTGILERKDRENKEIDFKERPNFNSLNTIVATSTLEMGIDIGTLNTAINNAVPPLTSNFLQRVGRAGRSSGTAMIATFAQSKAHDLFYFEEPSDMMEGEIATPGCYLEAKEILYRHFLAYCLDNWATADYINNKIPGRISDLKLSNTDLTSFDFVINRIISFIKSNELVLLNRFTDFYKPDLKEDSKVLENLKQFLDEDTFYARIKNVFSRVKEELISIQKKRKEIDETIKKNNLPETDEERKNLEGDKKALYGLKKIIEKRAILEHLTNVGLLPNYAFPETGVTLNAWVNGNKPKASTSLPSNKQFEIIRSSNVAIRELAPDNMFYSQGYKLAISGLNTFDWKDADVLIKKRFCSNCDHIENNATTTETNCPKCGDNSWSSAKNQHTFVKITGVKSINTRENAALDDSSDDRDVITYRISKHIKFDYNTFQGAWGMKNIPFGIEYVKNVDITEVNLGLSSVTDANKITINNLEDIPNHGFVTCKHCGKSSSTPHKAKNKETNNFKFHYGYCKNKDYDYQGKTDAVFEEVFLFREMKTEALKVLLPVQDLESEAQVNMFKAGLELGLKKYYKGNPQHLNIVNYSEFNKQNSRFDKYLVILDNIPGGTGYLEKLFDPSEFTEVIKKAYEAIKECNCQHNGKDGCYRCIYTYSNQYIQEDLSRNKAEILFKKIVDNSSGWEPYSSGLGSLSGNGQIEESELEDRFIRSLRNYCAKNAEQGFIFESYIEDAIINYKLKTVNGDYTFYYVIRPQLELGPAENVKYKTRSDFYISLTSAEKEGVTLSDDKITSVKNIAVYLDGYTYHATKENCRFYNDLQKRNAIVESGDKITWSLSWSDIEKFDAIEKESDPVSKQFKKDALAVDGVKYKTTIELYKKIPYWNNFNSDFMQTKNAMERLCWLLSNPLQEQFTKQKIGLALAIQQTQFAIPSMEAIELIEVLNKPSIVINQTVQAANKNQGNFYNLPDIQLKYDFASLAFGIRLNDLSIKAACSVTELQENLEKQNWELFWQLYNLIQEDCILVNETIDTTILPTNPDEIIDKYDCLKYHEEELHQIVKQLIDNTIPFNEEGGFYIEHEGIYAEAMLGFENKKIVIQPLSDEDRKIFKKAGYQEINTNEFNINQII
jgi:DEAD/DEAH box helicase domain-containing protein